MVAEIALGIVVGPQVLDLAHTDNFIEALSTFGLAFLFFLAGMEIDFERIKGAPVELGVGGWLMSIVIGAVAAVALHVTGVIHATVLVALALTTTALGTLMPILRDSGILDQRFGNFVVGAGAAGEFGPVVIVSVILAFDAGEAAGTARCCSSFAASSSCATVSRCGRGRRASSGWSRRRWAPAASSPCASRCCWSSRSPCSRRSSAST